MKTTLILFIAMCVVAAAAGVPSAAQTPPSPTLEAKSLEVEVFEDRLTPIYLSAKASGQGVVAFSINTPPSNGRITEIVPVQGSPNIVVVYYESFKNANENEDEFVYVATQGDLTSSATVKIEIRDVGLRWDLSVAGTTSSSQNVNALTQPNFLFRLDWMIKSPWHKLGRTPESKQGQRLAELNAIRKMYDFAAVSQADVTRQPESGKAINRATNVRLTFDTGFVSTPVMDTAMELGADASGEDGMSADSDGEEGSEETPVQTTQNAFRISGEAAGNFVMQAGDGRTVAELGGAARVEYNVPVQEDQVLRQNGVTFVNLASAENSPGFFVVEAFARFRLTQLEDEGNIAIDPRKITATGGGHIVHPKNLEDLLVIEAGYQRNDGLSDATAMDDGMGGSAANAMAMAMNPGVDRWFFRFMASPEIPNSGHTKALVGLEVSDGFDDAAVRNVRVFYGVNVSIDEVFR